MSVTRAEIEHIAKLARIEIPAGQFEKLSRDMSEIVNMVNKLSELELENVKVPLPDRVNALRDDEVKPSYSRDDILKNAPSSEAGCFLVPRVVE